MSFKWFLDWFSKFECNYDGAVVSDQIRNKWRADTAIHYIFRLAYYCQI